MCVKHVYNAKDASCGRYMPLPSLCSIVNAHAMQSSLSSFSTPAAFSERYDMTIDTPLRPPPRGRRARAGTGKITKYRGAIGMSDIEKKTIANHVKSQNPEQTACRTMFQNVLSVFFFAFNGTSCPLSRAPHHGSNFQSVVLLHKHKPPKNLGT